MLLFGFSFPKKPATTSTSDSKQPLSFDVAQGTVASAPFTERHHHEKEAGGLDHYTESANHENEVDGLDHYIESRMGEDRFRID